MLKKYYTNTVRIALLVCSGISLVAGILLRNSYPLWGRYLEMLWFVLLLIVFILDMFLKREENGISKGSLLLGIAIVLVGAVFVLLNLFT